ncbi:hypothetical protein HDV02_005653 [Globomyces sp. JEL0801]|nr:hypothetical protein HDV02_005653 [Globomyces sp. JEL0801]
MSIPKIPSLIWDSYLSSTNSLLNIGITNINDLLSLKWDSIQNDHLETLYNHHQTNLLCKYITKNLNSISMDIQYELFFRSCIDGNSILLSTLLLNTNLDPSASDNFAIRRKSNIKYSSAIQEYLSVDPLADDINDGICFAATSGHSHCLSILLQNDRLKMKNVNDGYWCAAAYGHLDCLQILLDDKRTNPCGDHHFNSAVRKAAENGHADCLALLLSDPRVDPAIHDNYPLLLALKNRHLDCIRLLENDSRVIEAFDTGFF